MSATWWSVVRYSGTVIVAGLASAQQYYPQWHWIAIVLVVLATLGFHVVPTSPPLYKMTVSQPQVPKLMPEETTKTKP